MKKPLALLVLGAALASGTVLLARRPAAHPPAPRAVPMVGPSGIRAEGRVVPYPGAQVVVGTDAAGTIARLLVSEKSVVKKGDLLAELNADVDRAALAQARARVAEAGADRTLAAAERARAEQLFATKVGTAQAVDKAARDLEADEARLATARADVDRLAATVAKSRILAPISGVVLARHVEPGETLARGAAVATIADLSRRRVEAEVDEGDAARVLLSARARVHPQGEEGPPVPAHVEEIPDAVTARRTRPEDPGRPSDTRVLLVKLALDAPSEALKLGRRVEIEIDAR